MRSELEAGSWRTVPEGYARQRLLMWAAVLLIGGSLALLPLPLGLAAVAALVAVRLALWRPVWALVIVLAAIPMEIFVLELGSVGLSAVQIAALAVGGLMSAEMLAVGRFEIPRTPLDVPIFVWLAVGFLGSIEALDVGAAAKKAVMTLVFVAIFYLVVARVRHLRSVSLLMKALIGACTVVGGYGVWVSYRYMSSGAVTGKTIIVGSEGLAVPRAASTVGDPTLLAAIMVIAIPIGIVLVATLGGWQRIAAVGACIVLFAALGFTYTRGAWIGAVAGLAVLALEKRSRRVLVLAAIVLAVMIPPSVLQRAATSTDTGRAEISHRFDYMSAAFLIFEKRPVFGAGLGNFPASFIRLPVPGTAQRFARHAHNIVLVLMSETGLVGLFAYGSMMLGVFWLLLRRRRNDPIEEVRLWRLAITASFVGSLVHQMTDSFLIEPTVNSIVWVFAGLAVVLGTGSLEEERSLRESGIAAVATSDAGADRGGEGAA